MADSKMPAKIWAGAASPNPASRYWLDYKPRYEGATSYIRADLVEQMAAALRECRRELNAVKDGSVDGIPNAICLLIPEAIERTDAALQAYEAAQPAKQSEAR